jgi:hypothetical protein
MVLDIAISSRRSRDLDVHRVDPMLGFQHLGGDVAAEGRQCVHGLRDLRLDDAAHLEHARRDRAQLGIELGGQVFVGHDLLSGRRGSRLHGLFTRISQ